MRLSYATFIYIYIDYLVPIIKRVPVSETQTSRTNFTTEKKLILLLK